MTAGRSAADASVVEQQPVAEVLPGLYRAVLDAVADLELRGHRLDAAKLRVDATRAYSGAWNPAAAHRMRILTARAARTVASRRAGPRDSFLTGIGRRNVERTSL